MVATMSQNSLGDTPVRYDYEIHPRSTQVGGGWQLRLIQDGQEVGGGVFPPVSGIEDQDEALNAAFEDAQETAAVWLEGKQVK